MNGIQGFYIGGGVDASGGGVYKKTTQQKLKASRESNAERLQQQREKFNRDNKNQNRQTREDFIRDSTDRRNIQRQNEFAEDFQKLVGPAGSATFLFSGNPNAQAFMKKYGLKEGDLAKLRLSVTQRGFRDLGEGIFQDVQDRFKLSGPMFNIQDALSQYRKGMTPFDRLPSQRSGIMGFVEDKFGAGPFSRFGDFLAGGSPMGSAALAFGKLRGLEGDQLNQFASSIANNRDLYNQMMMTPEMQRRSFEQNLINIERGLPRNSGNQVTEPEPDPITAAYNPSMNPFLNQGIQPFSFMV